MQRITSLAGITVLALALGACATEPAVPSTGIDTSTTTSSTSSSLPTSGLLISPSSAPTAGSTSGTSGTAASTSTSGTAVGTTTSGTSVVGRTTTSGTTTSGTSVVGRTTTSGTAVGTTTSGTTTSGTTTSGTAVGTTTSGTTTSGTAVGTTTSGTSVVGRTATSGTAVGTTTSGTSGTTTSTSTSGGAGVTVSTDDIVAVLSQNGDFTTLINALQLSGLDQTLAQAGPYTIFAPTDTAFASLSPLVLQQLLADPTKLQSVLSYHVINGDLSAAQISQQSSITTIEGQPLAVSTSGTAVILNNSARITDSFDTGNGSIHVIDKVLIPANANISQ